MTLSIKKIFPFIIFGMMMLATTTIFAASVPWQSYSNSAFQKAKAEHKRVLIYVNSTSCHWCALMNSESFNQPATIDMLTNKFIPVSVNIVTDKAIADQYGAYGTPTFIILDSDRHEVSRETGYQTANEFRAYLESL